MIRANLSVLAGLALLVVPATASADATSNARARAAESFRQGQAAFERREFAAAAAAFEAAAAFVPHPAALLSAADAWERAGEAARAAEDCDRARALPDVGDASATDRVDYGHDATRCVDRLRRRVALLDVRGSGAVAVRIDGAAEQVLPVRHWVRPGHHVVTIVDLDTSHAHTQDVAVTAGEERSIDVSAPAPTPVSAYAPTRAATPSPAPADRSHSLPTSAWIAFGVAAPACVAYGLFAFMTVGAKNDYDASPTASTRDAFYRDRTLADVTFGVAAVAAAAGVVLWLTAPAGEAPRAGLGPPALVRF